MTNIYDNVYTNLMKTPEAIEVGKQYFAEEKYYWCGNVTIIADECGEDKETLKSKDWVGYKIRIDESFGGMSPMPVGKEFSVGHDSKYSHYGSVRIKPLGSMPEYTGFTGEKDWRNHK